MQPVLAHAVGVLVTGGTELYDPQFVRRADVVGSAVGAFSLEGTRIAAVAVVTADPAFRMDAEQKGAAHVGVTDYAAIARIDTDFLRWLLWRSECRGCKRVPHCR
jgi:hypothetical protein